MTFDEWFAGHRRLLIRCAAALSGVAATAEDIVAEVAVRAHRRWDQINTLDHSEAYLRRMVVNEDTATLGRSPNRHNRGSDR